MAYTAPTTRATGDLITASIWNTDMVNNIIDLRANPYSASVYNSGNVNHTTSGAFQVMTFDSEGHDTNTIHDNATNNSRLTCKTAGRYLVFGTICFASSATTIGVRLSKGGVEAVSRYQPGVAIAGQGMAIQATLDLSVNDYMEILGYQSSGGTLAMLGGSGGAVSGFGMFRVGG